MEGSKILFEIWQKLEKLFASQFKAQIMQHKMQLQTMKKGGANMVEYLLKMKGIIDALASTGHIVSEDDQILHVLIGLSPEYDALVVSITQEVSRSSLKMLLLC